MIWVRSYKYPDQWVTKIVDGANLPKPLLLELLGSRKKILFFEGQKGSIDEDDSFLLSFAKKIIIDNPSEVVSLIKSDILNKLETDIEIQVSNYISAKINYYFTDTDVSKGNSLTDVRNNYEDFNKKVNVDLWYSERKSELEAIIENKAYNKAIIVYNNKGYKNYSRS